MIESIKKVIFLLFIFLTSFFNIANSQSEEIKEILEIIQKDLRTLERAVYSESFSPSSTSNVGFIPL